jgi:putative redox protein
MKIKLQSIDGMHMRAVNENGNTIEMDGSADIGGKNKAMTPMQVLLSSLGGCSSIDVLMILNKQKAVFTQFEIELLGNREQVNDAKIFRQITMHFIIGCNLSRTRVERAINLSLEKYCSVAKTLEPTASIDWKLTLNGEE